MRGIGPHDAGLIASRSPEFEQTADAVVIDSPARDSLCGLHLLTDDFQIEPRVCVAALVLQEFDPLDIHEAQIEIAVFVEVGGVQVENRSETCGEFPVRGPEPRGVLPELHRDGHLAPKPDQILRSIVVEVRDTALWRTRGIEWPHLFW